MISEIGYRNNADALFQPWVVKSIGRPDPQEQAAAYQAVLVNVLADPWIEGVFFWAWDDVEAMSLRGQPAVALIRQYFMT